MRIISDSMAEFSISINPFLRRIQILNLERGDAGVEMVTWNYAELDEWYSTWIVTGKY